MGSLPKVFEFHEEDRILLRSYVQTYLKDEIVAEQLDTTFNLLEIFEVAAQLNGQILNYSKIARDINAEVPTVQSILIFLLIPILIFLNPIMNQFENDIVLLGL